MKTLYESILDNEDVLMDDVKKSNTPINRMGSYNVYVKKL